MLVDSFAKVNALNAYFSSVGTVDNGNTLDCQCFVLQSVLDSIVIDTSDVMWSISRLKTNFSCGPDNIPPLLFVKLKHCLCYPLAYIFNQLVSVGAVPPEWKNAFITSVRKKELLGWYRITAQYHLLVLPAKLWTELFVVEYLIIYTIIIFSTEYSTGLKKPIYYNQFTRKSQ